MAAVQRRGSAGFRPLTLFIAVDYKKLNSLKLPADLFVRRSVYWRTVRARARTLEISVYVTSAACS